MKPITTQLTDSNGFSSRRNRLLLAAGLAAVMATPVLAQMGACCLPHGACAVATVLECRNLGGVWKGAGTSCTPGLCPRSYSYTGVPVAIPDASTITGTGTPASIVITIPDSVTISAVSPSFIIQHPNQGDLRVILTHVETGHTATLVDRPGLNPLTTGGGFTADNFGTSLVSPTNPPSYFAFDDAVTGTYGAPNVPYPGINNVVGTYQPVSPLSVFAGETAAGTWRLTATDFVAGNAGSIVGFNLQVIEPAQLSPGTAAMTMQGLIPDADLLLLHQAAGLSGDLSYSSTYIGTGWSAQMCGRFQGQSTCLTYSSSTASVTATSATWSVGGQLGAAAVNGSGSAQFYPITGGYSIILHESLNVGTRSFTVDGSYTGTVDIQGHLNVNTGSDTIADSANPGGGNPGWGRRWVFDINTGMWVSMYRAWDPWYGWQDYAFNESYFAPLAQPGWFTMTQSLHTSCYANCDGSTVAPILNANDFTCFLNKFAAGDPAANCDGSTAAPTLNANDFTCYLNKFAAGCT
jgi:subtilisin-like proprotein convertase family protein